MATLAQHRHQHYPRPCDTLSRKSWITFSLTYSHSHSSEKKKARCVLWTCDFVSVASALLKPRMDMSDHVVYRIPSTGKQFILNGIAKSYSENIYPPQLKGIVSRDELRSIISRLNDTLLSYWPCGPCYYFGYIFIPCKCLYSNIISSSWLTPVNIGTIGLSLCCPYFCVSEAEKSATYFLEQTSLRSKYYERNIVFYIEKGICSSFFAVKVPRNLINMTVGENDLEENIIYTAEHIAHDERRHLKGN